MFISAMAALGVVSFALCVASEFKRTKRKDLKLDGGLCYLPGSRAFGFGIAALICLFGAQIIGNFIICAEFWSREKRIGCRAPKPTVACAFLLLSWISFGISVILIGAATSMNKRQPYGEGWLDGECYVAKDGVYIGAAILVLVALCSTLASITVTNKKREVEQGRKIYARF
ncbi:hypothetical protein U1Q18_018947 [Sarracenia purpurea var. burkii]